MKTREKNEGRKPRGKRVLLSLDAPGASSVKVAGAFNAWDTGKGALKKNQKGVWTKILSLEPGSYEYKFVVDGKWMLDPACDETVGNPFGGLNSVLRV